MRKSLSDPAHAAQQTPIRVVSGARLHRPVNHDGPAYDRTLIDKTPVTAVGAAVAVVSHHEVIAGRHHQFPVLDVIHDLAGPLRAQVKQSEARRSEEHTSELQSP